eukprot:gene10014-biopygen8315
MNDQKSDSKAFERKGFSVRKGAHWMQGGMQSKYAPPHCRNANPWRALPVETMPSTDPNQSSKGWEPALRGIEHRPATEHRVAAWLRHPSTLRCELQ